MQAVFRPVLVDPTPYHFRVAVGIRNIDGAAEAVSSRTLAAAVQGPAHTRLVAAGETLAIIIAEGAENRPLDALCVHCAPGVIKLLTELRVHAADHVIGERYAHLLGRRRVLPCEIPRMILLRLRALVHFPKIEIDIFHDLATARAADFFRSFYWLARLISRKCDESANFGHNDSSTTGETGIRIDKPDGLH